MTSNQTLRDAAYWAAHWAKETSRGIPDWERSRRESWISSAPTPAIAWERRLNVEISTHKQAYLAARKAGMAAGVPVASRHPDYRPVRWDHGYPIITLEFFSADGCWYAHFGLFGRGWVVWDLSALPAGTSFEEARRLLTEPNPDPDVVDF